ncbi:MAG TPA: RNA pseudouridine synthase, partial [Kineobactrum sp.]
MTEKIRAQATVGPGLDGERLDQVAAQLFPEYSRSRLQTWIKQG